MQNKRMEEKLRSGEAVDVSNCRKTEDGDYILKQFIAEVDYCNAKEETWIWSIGQDLNTGQVLASHSAKFYLNPAYNCLWLR